MPLVQRHSPCSGHSRGCSWGAPDSRKDGLHGTTKNLALGKAAGVLRPYEPRLGAGLHFGTARKYGREFAGARASARLLETRRPATDFVRLGRDRGDPSRSIQSDESSWPTRRVRQRRALPLGRGVRPRAGESNVDSVDGPPAVALDQRVCNGPARPASFSDDYWEVGEPRQSHGSGFDPLVARRWSDLGLVLPPVGARQLRVERRRPRQIDSGEQHRAQARTGRQEHHRGRCLCQQERRSRLA